MALPVDPDRLRKEFPALTDEDMEAYVSVTRRILAAGSKERPKITRQVLDGGRQAREKSARGEAISAQESLWARYLAAVDKMQPRRPPEAAGTAGRRRPS